MAFQGLQERIGLQQVLTLGGTEFIGLGNKSGNVRVVKTPDCQASFTPRPGKKQNNDKQHSDQDKKPRRSYGETKGYPGTNEARQNHGGQIELIVWSGVKAQVDSPSRMRKGAQNAATSGAEE